MATACAITTYHHLRDQAATMGIVLFALRHGKRVPDHDQQINLGIEACNVIVQGQELAGSRKPENADAIMFAEGFRSLLKRQERGPDGLPSAADALMARSVCERILNSETVSIEELRACGRFFERVYSAL